MCPRRMSNEKSGERVSMPLRICVIGCGGLSSRAHGPSLAKYAANHPGTELTACCDLDSAKATRYRQANGFLRQYNDFREMLNVETPDAVCLYVPVTETARMSIQLLDLGVPVLLEKPPGMTVDECTAMINASESTGTANQVAFNRRYTPLVARLRESLRSGFAESDIQNIRYDFFRINRCDADFSTTAIHGIDTVRFLAGVDYEEIRFTYQPFPELGPTTANIYLECTFRSGATAQLNFCPVSGVLIERATVNLFNHTYFLDVPIWQAFDFPGRLRHLHKGETVEDVEGSQLGDGTELFELSGFYHENAAFLDDIREGRSPEGNIRSGLQSVAIAEAIRNRAAVYRRS